MITSYFKIMLQKRDTIEQQLKIDMLKSQIYSYMAKPKVLVQFCFFDHITRFQMHRVDLIKNIWNVENISSFIFLNLDNLNVQMYEKLKEKKNSGFQAIFLSSQ
ncbi:unnamed protein product [Paramecium octaurelia]|uniref:Uncharacterized protein n=1 Tax=Paramecium octaurelia TaxID=43137 RepID=A0A8S1SVM5_PAROT|nr:unnamed protein product [Paramecium octaurelia]